MKEISYKEIEELVEGGIVFTKNRQLVFSECEQMEQWAGCIALRDIIGNPPYFAFFIRRRNSGFALYLTTRTHSINYICISKTADITRLI